MKCPKCLDNDLKDFTHEGVEFDICSPGCKGIWCDKGELAYYTETFKDTPLKHDLESTGTETNLNCPVCKDVHLKEYPYQEGHDLLIEICPKCHGIYLDNKELAQVQKIAVDIDKSGKLVRTIRNIIDLTNK